MPDWSALRRTLCESGITFGPSDPRPVGGGDISAAWRVGTKRGLVFMKTFSADGPPMFAAEAAGLNALRAANAVRVPAVLAEGVSGADSYLVLEWLDLESPNPRSEKRLGSLLAAQHRAVGASHGWHRDNTIGPTPQLNTPTTSWCEFFVQQRLKAQLDLAVTRGAGRELASRGDALLTASGALLKGHEPEPALLHGDLWAGNQAAIGDEPVLFDPAVYYGDRETDIAMTRLFGGFSASFYSAYRAAWPLPVGAERRVDCYQLYHLLNHVNIFGRSYLGRAVDLIERIIAAA